MKKIALFVDVQNIFYTVKERYGCFFNYRTLLSELKNEGDIIMAHAYAIDRGDRKQIIFQNFLRESGFNVKLKPYISRADGSKKGDWDVGITIDILDAVFHNKNNIDCIVLLSGDGDFDLLLRRLEALPELSSIVYAVRELTARSLIEATTEFRPICEHLLLKNSP
ncbi:MAG: nuclease [Cellvibrionales bacterium TMED49]|nr:MAG: nuclease [Cellvibrionales bacterium TMED49]